ncbi:MAG: flagellar hook-associated protein FlgL [Tissierellia bacterium]|nr:flagellar hook-associated protein FlgL [Tissierellia bacterium]
MRITNNMLINNMVYNLNQNLKTMENLQYQLATGKKFRVPSDDPIGASKSLKFSTDISKLTQYKRNAEDAMSWLDDTEAAMAEINQVLKRAYELSVQTANGTYEGEDLIMVREEIEQLKEHLLQIANTTYAGRHIFNGYNTDKPLLIKDNGEIVYNTELKQDEIFQYNVGLAEKIEINTIGIKVFGVVQAGNYEYDVDVNNPSTKPALIDVLDRFSQALAADDDSEIQKTISNLQASMEQLLSVRAEVGAKMNRLELTTKKLDSQINNVTELLSHNEDVDVTEAIMNLSMAQNVYVSSLMTGAKIIQPTLAQFLG